jgi:hypothetical protein
MSEKFTGGVIIFLVFLVLSAWVTVGAIADYIELTLPTENSYTNVLTKQ